MAEGEGDQPESGWLLEPPGPDEVHVEIGLGSEVELSPEALAALERLMSSLETAEEAEVAGFACGIGPCSNYRICTGYGRCRPLETGSCFAFTHCRIGFA